MSETCFKSGAWYISLMTGHSCFTQRLLPRLLFSTASALARAAGFIAGGGPSAVGRSRGGQLERKRKSREAKKRSANSNQKHGAHQDVKS